MNKDLLKKQWLVEEKRAFQGWDFSVFEGRIVGEELPWDYKKIVLSYLKTTDRLLDMGTGGGEILLSLGHPHHNAAVTEGYMPNYELCKSTLEPIGITVSFVNDDSKLNFEDEVFDLVINRHEAYDIQEVYRVLKKGGVFITQQVGADNNRELACELLGDLFVEPVIHHDLESAWKSAEALGFEVIEGDKNYSKVSYKDIGALVYLAKIVNWEFSGFSVEACFTKLCAFQKKLESNQKVEGTEHRYYSVMRK